MRPNKRKDILYCSFHRRGTQPAAISMLRSMTSRVSSALTRLREAGVVNYGRGGMEGIKGEAAVLVLLYEAEDDLHVLLTERASNLSSHAGEIAFPGGKRDPEDTDILQTALRETREEVGVEPHEVEVMCTISPLLSKHLLAVTPVVALARAPINTDLLNLNADEVRSAFTIPLSTFLSSKYHRHRDANWMDHPIRMHFYDVPEGYTVWGLTAWIGILCAQLAYARDAEFPVAVVGAPDFANLVYKNGKLVNKE
eukprot:comp39348_c0_seq1/m.47376 comp39348_c0_seq1/g.47376  ORF comp39348_c0_seq1/g.47376 comp39348_c0_seq1/m.47376 type:complete len:254 (-) comp39348_c0_seq1:255-1016(-)